MKFCFWGEANQVANEVQQQSWLVTVIDCQILSTSPAPPVVALWATHVHAARVLLNRHLAFGTAMSANLVGPSLVHLLLSRFARLLLVPFSATAEAEKAIAMRASHFLSILRCFYHLRALWEWAELLITTQRNIVVLLEFLILVIGGIVDDLLQERVGDFSATALLWTL